MSIPATHPAIRQAIRKGLIDLGPTRSVKPKAPTPAGPAKVTVSWWLPGFRLQSEANMGGSLAGKLRRKAVVKAAVAAALELVPVPAWRFPVRVRLTRVGARLLDGDNLQSSFKVCRDVVAAWLEVDDGNTARVTWRYRQRKARKGESVGVRITIQER